MTDEEGNTTEKEPEVEVNEEALEEEIERRTIELEIPVDDVHAGISDTLREGGVDVEQVLAQRLQPAAENAIHEVLQQAKYQQ